MPNLFLLILLLVCPLMMVFMMRGMHGGHGSSVAGGQQQAGDHGSHSLDAQASDARIAQLEHEVASLRSVQGERTGQRRVFRP